MKFGAAQMAKNFARRQTVRVIQGFTDTNTLLNGLSSRHTGTNAESTPKKESCMALPTDVGGILALAAAAASASRTSKFNLEGGQVDPKGPKTSKNKVLKF